MKERRGAALLALRASFLAQLEPLRRDGTVGSASQATAVVGRGEDVDEALAALFTFQKKDSPTSSGRAVRRAGGRRRGASSVRPADGREVPAVLAGPEGRRAGRRRRLRALPRASSASRIAPVPRRLALSSASRSPSWLSTRSRRRSCRADPAARHDPRDPRVLRPHARAEHRRRLRYLRVLGSPGADDAPDARRRRRLLRPFSPGRCRRPVTLTRPPDRARAHPRAGPSETSSTASASSPSRTSCASTSTAGSGPPSTWPTAPSASASSSSPGTSGAAPRRSRPEDREA